MTGDEKLLRVRKAVEDMKLVDKFAHHGNALVKAAVVNQIFVCDKVLAEIDKEMEK